MRLRDLVEGEDRYQLYEWFDAHAETFHYSTKLNADTYVNLILDGKDTSDLALQLFSDLHKTNTTELKIPIQLGRVNSFTVFKFEVNNTVNWPECKSFRANSVIGNTESIIDYCMEKVEYDVEFWDTKLTMDDVMQLMGTDKYVRYSAQVGTGIMEYLYITSDGAGIIKLKGDRSGETLSFDSVFELQSWLVEHDDVHAAFKA